MITKENRAHRKIFLRDHENASAWGIAEDCEPNVTRARNKE
jgi:hypothetical protein